MPFGGPMAISGTSCCGGGTAVVCNGCAIANARLTLTYVRGLTCQDTPSGCTLGGYVTVEQRTVTLNPLPGSPFSWVSDTVVEDNFGTDADLLCHNMQYRKFRVQCVNYFPDLGRASLGLLDAAGQTESAMLTNYNSRLSIPSGWFHRWAVEQCSPLMYSFSGQTFHDGVCGTNVWVYLPYTITS